MTDKLRQELQAAAQAVRPRLKSAEQVRSGARTHHRTRVAATASAAALAVAVGLTATGVLGNGLEALLSDAKPVPAAPRVTEPTPAVSTSPTPSAPSPTTFSRSPKPAGNPLSGFRFPEEAGWKPGAGTTVNISVATRAAWALDPCRPTAYPSDSLRIASRTASVTGPEYGNTRQVSVYTNKAAAMEAMAQFRRVLRACATRDPDANGLGSTWSSTAVAAGDDAFLAWQRSTQDGQPVYPGKHVVVVRDGRSIYLASADGESIPTGPNDEAAKSLTAAARKQLPLPQ